jgi:hypothetical protein
MSYQEKYPVGTTVTIASTERLLKFKSEWKFHHPLQEAQLLFAGTTDKVRTVGFYHGGDVVYNLEKATGTWHEEVLDPN